MFDAKLVKSKEMVDCSFFCFYQFCKCITLQQMYVCRCVCFSVWLNVVHVQYSRSFATLSFPFQCYFMRVFSGVKQRGVKTVALL